jgi:ABC-type transport system involved in cytochrome bd biosynthesis fused ATPase/permease subunit
VKGWVTVPGPVFYATQRPLLVAGSVVDNLALAAPGVTRRRARAALESVGLWRALAGRQGLDTPLGDDGFGLSAGQRARLALARARLSAAPVVLLDEPTAHVEAGDVPALHELLLDLASHRRVVVATHDPALVAIASSHWTLEQPQERVEEAVQGSGPEVTDAGGSTGAGARRGSAGRPWHQPALPAVSGACRPPPEWR